MTRHIPTGRDPITVEHDWRCFDRHVVERGTHEAAGVVRVAWVCTGCGATAPTAAPGHDAQHDQQRSEQHDDTTRTDDRGDAA